MKLVSLIVPMFNEARNLDELRRRICAAVNLINDRHFEIILVDDHSADATRAKSLDWAADDDRVVYLRFSRNFGAHSALSAGLRSARGDCAILLAADLQDPPEMIPKLLDRWQAAYRVVWAVRASREGIAWTARLTSSIFWRLMRLVARDATPATAADFVLLDRQVIDAYLRMNSRNESIIAAICWLGFEQTYVPYAKDARRNGRSGWTLAKKCKLFIDSAVGFSYWPIRAMSILGIGCAALGFLFLVYLIWHRLSGYTAVQGWAGLMSAILTGMGILMVMVGVLGEYLWRVLDEARGRPKYIFEETRCSGSQSQAGAVGGDSPFAIKSKRRAFEPEAEVRFRTVSRSSMEVGGGASSDPKQLYFALDAT